MSHDGSLISVMGTGSQGTARVNERCTMDEKVVTALSTSLALMQIQVNALLLMFERQHPEAFHQ
jgi:hypothetical protein